MRLQIELTTKCNFDCFYCTGRHMAQEDMPWAMIKKTLDENLPVSGEINYCILQGEGEPSLHKDLFKAAEYAKSKGWLNVHTVTNGTHKHPEKFKVFDEVQVSLDSAVEADAEAIGRHNLPATLKFILALRDQGTSVSITSVMLPTNTDAIKSVSSFAVRNGIKHQIQSLAVKPDYAVIYPHIALRKVEHPEKESYRCYFPKGKFITVKGTELPCCRIKNLSQFVSIEQTFSEMASGIVPPSCSGCEMLK